MRSIFNGSHGAHVGIFCAQARRWLFPYNFPIIYFLAYHTLYDGISTDFWNFHRFLETIFGGNSQNWHLCATWLVMHCSCPQHDQLFALSVHRAINQPLNRQTLGSTCIADRLEHSVLLTYLGQEGAGCTHASGRTGPGQHNPQSL